MALFRQRRVNEDLPAAYAAVKNRRDRALLEELVSHGVDLTQPHHVLHYIHAYTKEDQCSAGVATRALGWDAATRDPLPDSPNQWIVVGQKHGVVLTPDEVVESRAAFEAIAARIAGTYDGWEAV